MAFVKRKGTISKIKHSVSEIKKKFFAQIIKMEEICGELKLNWDQTWLKMVSSSSWTMDKREMGVDCWC